MTAAFISAAVCILVIVTAIIDINLRPASLSTVVLLHVTYCIRFSQVLIDHVLQ